MLWFAVGCFWCQSSIDVSSNVCSYYLSSVLVWERTAPSVDHMFSLYFDFL